MKNDIKHIVDDMWNTYRKDVIPPEASAQQITECRRAFYAGLISATIPMAIVYGKATAQLTEALRECCKEFIIEGATVEANDNGL